MDTGIGHNFRRIRESLGLGILDVSVETGYSESHIAQLERDKRRPSFDCMMDLMSYYGCEPNDIFGVDSETSSSGEGDRSYEDRLQKLTAKDKLKAKKAIEAILQVFEEGVE